MFEYRKVYKVSFIKEQTTFNKFKSKYIKTDKKIFFAVKDFKKLKV